MIGLGEHSEWLRPDAPASDVVVSSRVRLARNFAGFPFPNRAKREDKRQIMDLAERHLMRAGLAPRMAWIELSDVSSLERGVLVERHLISKQLAKGDEPRAVAVSTPDERLAVMVNEEDHLRIQVMRAGLALSDAFAQINDIDDRVEAHADIAYHQRFGYLTACPTNVGTGIRVSVMMHLPGLKLTGEIEKVRRAAKGMSLAVRGFYGEGSEAVGDFFQISNQTTFGKSELEILQEFEGQIIPKVIEYERIARRNLLERRKVLVEDRVFRALGTLRHARLLKSDEALELLSSVRLGVTLGLLCGIDPVRVGRLLLLTQPAHLQKQSGRELDQAARRVERATLVRSMLS
ncbi:MAG TPA: protein arginine kinase [Phycisphaerales bacterium]|nr:protein arginine kinase [Phycisphaerales bacterium]